MKQWERIAEWVDSHTARLGIAAIVLVFVFLLALLFSQASENGDKADANERLARENKALVLQLVEMERQNDKDRDYLVSVIEKLNVQIIESGGTPVVNVAEVAEEVTRRQTSTSTSPRRTTPVAQGPRGEPGPAGPQGPPGEDASTTTTTEPPPTTTTTEPEPPCSTVPLVGACSPL